jgi:hypothetical protein
MLTNRPPKPLVEALRYNPEGRGLDSQWSHWNFSLTKSIRPLYGSGVDSASQIAQRERGY